MLAHEVREKYIEFFKSRGHLQMPSAPLIPIDVLGEEDETTLFSGSGMEQFKPFFTGAATPPNRRVTTVQKCVRTNDIDSVGDLSHCTFFEMLGNFSFGDYFKAEVIPWTWDFLINVIGLDPDRLCCTVFSDDDEAYDIWHNVIGLPADRIHRLGEDKNYWPANAISQGPNGPCGPCSEIYYRVAPLEEMCSDSSLTPAQRFLLDDEESRWLEIWNNVFTQFNRSEDENGQVTLTPLPQKNNDTGAGFDRIVQVKQDKKSVFETDLFQPILDRIVELSGGRYEGSHSPTDFAFRVVAEHTRAMVFCIADGITPDKVGRGYVLRYIMRRAIRYGKTVLGFDAPFLHEVAPRVIEQMGGFYTELVERRELILHTIREEEEQFRRTLDNGLARLNRMLEQPAVRESNVLKGSDAFTLYDTYGFPPKLTEEIAAERGIVVDLGGFDAAMEEQRTRSRERSDMGKELFSATTAATASLKEVSSEFVGYTSTESTDSIVRRILLGEESVDSARAGDEIRIVLDHTPFYAESGGQVGDTGVITSEPGNTTCAVRIRVLDTQKSLGVTVHRGRVEEGEVFVDQRVRAFVDVDRRRDIMRNHTATHLLQAAMRQTLGSHVHQKGSLVAPDRLRFDFTHSQPVSAEELRTIEEKVNNQILEGTPVVVHVDLPIAEARARGAMALFGEKYGDRVRMVEVPGFSMELCGGTHVSNVASIGLFKIVSESGVAAGVRRIEAVTGHGAIEFVNRREALLTGAAGLLKTTPTDLATAIKRLQDQLSEREKQIKELRSAATGSQTDDLTPQTINGIPVVIRRLDHTDAQAAADLADATVQKLNSAVVVFGLANDGKVGFTAKVSRDLIERGLHAGNLVKEIARIAGGGGGGRPDFAQAGGRDPGKLQEALDAVPGLIASQLR
jgi:alanyl-tRNA synthetase